MNGGRWYPSSTTLANGDILVTSGNAKNGVNKLPQVYQVDQNAWRDLTSAELSMPNYPRTFLAPNGLVFFAQPKLALPGSLRHRHLELRGATH